MLTYKLRKLVDDHPLPLLQFSNGYSECDIVMGDEEYYVSIEEEDWKEFEKYVQQRKYWPNYKDDSDYLKLDVEVLEEDDASTITGFKLYWY